MGGVESHGTHSGYFIRQCRCELCTDWKARDNERTVLLAQDREIVHGTSSAYRYGCRCDSCRSAKSAENAVSNPRRYDPGYVPEPLKQRYESVRDHQLRRKYGITLSEFELIRESQGGRCSICGDTPKRGLVVDHCHSSGRVRELLCGHCNSALGFARDDPEVLRKMALYVEAHSQSSLIN